MRMQVTLAVVKNKSAWSRKIACPSKTRRGTVWSTRRPSMAVQTYGARVKMLRERAKLTQDDLAKAVGLSRGMVAMVEGGRARFGREAESSFVGLVGCSREFIADAPLKAAP